MNLVFVLLVVAAVVFTKFLSMRLLVQFRLCVTALLVVFDNTLPLSLGDSLCIADFFHVELRGCLLGNLSGTR